MHQAEAVEAPVEHSEILPEPPQIEPLSPQEYLLFELNKKGLTGAYETLHRVAQCESQWNPDAVSPTNDYGVFQVNLLTHGKTPAYWLDWKNNIDYALYLYEKNGLLDWTMSQHCWG